jgi:hypothetical protein
MPEPRSREFSDALFEVADLLRSLGIERLDESYLVAWARRLGVEQELTYVLGGGTFDFGDSGGAR